MEPVVGDNSVQNRVFAAVEASPGTMVDRDGYLDYWSPQQEEGSLFPWDRGVSSLGGSDSVQIDQIQVIICVDAVDTSPAATCDYGPSILDDGRLTVQANSVEYAFRLYEAASGELLREDRDSLQGSEDDCPYSASLEPMRAGYVNPVPTEEQIAEAVRWQLEALDLR